MTDRTLSLAYGTDPFDLSALDVKRRERTRLLGAEAVVHVIGSSHYVAVPDRDLYELCSCEAVDDAVASVPLRTGHSQTVRFATEGAAVETLVETRPLDAFPGPDTAEVAYRFGPRAYTTIDRVREGYETYHTYPERDLAVYTRSTVSGRAETTAADSSGARDSVRSDGSGRAAARGPVRSDGRGPSDASRDAARRAVSGAPPGGESVEDRGDAEATRAGDHQ